MSTYREIVGKKIKKVSSDPSEGLDGQMWYNSTTGSLRGLAAVEAFVSSANQSEAKRAVAGFGTQTALVAAAGVPPPGSASNTTIEYNGNGWYSGTNTPTSHYNSRGFGTQTAGAILGGVPDDATTFEYDGSSWTAGGEYPANINLLFTSGTQTAGIGAGGHPAITTSNTYNGSSWTSTPAINTGRGSGSGAGTTSAMVIFGGGTGPNPGISNATEEYDGSSWTSVTNIPAATQFHGTAGTQTAAVYFGGSKPAVTNNSFTYDGSSFTAGPNLGTSRYTMATGTLGTQDAAICAGGFTGSANTGATEEFNKGTTAYTAAAWASIPTYPTPNSYSAGFGTTTASVAAGGDGPPGNGITTTGEYDGSSWTTGGALNTGRRGLGSATNGSETAGLVFGGSNPGVPTQYANVEEYNGSAWSEETNLPGTLNNLGGFGTQTAGAALPPSSATTLEYDGSSWTSGGSLNTTRDKTMGAGAGLQTAGLCIAGGPVPGVNGGIEEYNGTAWTATVPSTYVNDNNASNGIQTAALSMGASNPPSLAAGIQYDGTTASTVANMGTGRYAGTASGSAGNSSALAITGRTPPRSNACEEYTAETSSANIETFTTS